MASASNGEDLLAGKSDKTEPMAIIGMATRFPQEATNTEKLWEFLLKARSAHTPFPKDRINPDGHYHPDPEHGGTFAVKGGHFLSEDPAYFDAPFFSITKTEVLSLDPQQRVIMENVYQALENAGVPIAKATGTNTSVFVSGFNHDHLALLNSDPETTLKYKPTGTTNSLLSNRVSWFFDFKAPSLTIDTACSSSMVALHLACQSLKCGESEMSIVSGVTMISFPTEIASTAHHGFLSQEGRCFSFDHRADGYARGEGVGTVILKRLSDALRDGDTIRAVVRGTGVNQDGRTAGISLPSSAAQESLMRSIYANSGLGFDETMMVEAHGTGTAAGDPIEASAIARTFASRSKDIPLFVGAIKSGIGHLEGGAGIAGIIKSVLVLESGIIPPNVNFEKINPKIPIDKWNLQFPLANTPWPTPGLRRISVNSFGVGGTNGHAVLDDAYNYLKSRNLTGSHNTNPHTPTVEQIKDIVANVDRAISPDGGKGTLENGHSNGTSNFAALNGNHDTTGIANGNGLHNGNVVHKNDDSASHFPRLFLFTSFDEKGVKRNATTYAEYLKNVQPSQEDDYLRDLAYTLCKKRSIFPWRSYAVSSSLPELIESLSSEQGMPSAVRVGTPPKIGFVFTGQGAQWYAMGRELLIYSIFKKSLEDAATYMKSIGAEWSLLEEFSRNKDETKVNEPHLAHPSCAAIQIALVDLLASWNIRPTRVVGHSSGEIAAAYCAGKLSKEAAWKIAYFRGYVSAKQLGAKGAMMAVALSEADLQPYLKKVNEQHEGEMLIACYNAPKNNTISGDEHKIDALKALLDADKVFARKLNVLNAYHSGHMKALADEYLELMGDVSFGDRLPSADIYMFSSVNGQKVEKDTLDAQYWVDNMVSPVRFTDALLAMSFARLSKGQASLRLNASAENIFANTIVEIGPHTALQSAIKDTLATKVSSSSISYLSVLNRTSPGVHTILNTAGFLSSHSSSVDILAVNESTNPGASAPRTLVQLPPYSFKHSEKVWYESRLSKNYRLRKYPRHDLFGAPVPDWNSESPRWRHIIRLSEQPWLRDHVVTDSFVYPGVGYLIAVIEASRQIADPEMKIAGYRLRDVSLKRALIVPDNKEGIEISLSLTRMDESSLWGSSVWKKFQISSYNPLGEGDWIEHCTGYVSIDYATSPGPVDAGRESAAEAAKWKETLEDAKQRCVVPFDIDSTYDNLVTCGLTFGPLFKNLSEVKGTADARGEVTGLVTVPDIAAAMPKGFAHPHLIHPATMDSMIHLFITSVMDHIGKNSLQRAMVPTFMKDVWISAEVNNTPSHTFRGHGKSTLLAYDKYQSDIMVWDGTTDEARISIKGIRAASLESVDSGPSEARKLCHTIEWKLDADLLSPSSFPDVVHVTKEDNLDYKHWINRFQLGTLLRVTDALSVLRDFNPEVLQGHFIKYWNWMKQLEEWLQADQISGMKLSEWTEYNNSPSLKAELYEEIAAHNADGRLAMRMGSNIPQVLRKEVDPLHLMFGQDDLLDQVYEQVVKLGDLPALQQAYLKIIAHNCTNLRILEVGAGTGSSTAAMLDGLAQSSDDGKKKASRIEKYTFTDVSSGFFEKAKEKFKAFRNIMEYRTLNVEKDVSGQGFDLKSYDFIVAGNVIHATADLKKTLTNLRGLLKPGGKLILHEGIRQDYLWSNISFGQLPGWWLGVEPIREWSPWITPEQWDGILKEAGFSGVDLNLADREDPNLHTQSLLIGTAVNPSDAEPSSETQTVIVTTTPPSESPYELIITLKSHLESNLRIPNVSTVHYLDLATTDLSKSVCISVIELERSVLSTLTEAEYDNIRQLLVTCAGMIWITGDTLGDPSFNMIAGLTRTVRWERDIDDVNLVTLAVCEPKPAMNDLVSSIGKLYGQQFIATLPANQMNGEYMLQSTSFLSARLIDSDAGNDYLSSKSLRPKPVLQEFGEAGRPVKLATASPGQLDKLEWVTDPIYAEPLDDTHVEIEIKAVGLNFRDLMIAMGEHMAYSFGNEAAGVISRVGSLVTAFKPGDRVVYMCCLDSTGCFHTYGRVDQNVVVPIPDELSYEIACSLPCVYSTVIYGLVDAGRLLKGETILIHAAAGGVGQAAINFSKSVGAEIFATVSTPEKRELLMREYGIPEDHIFSSRDLTFVQGIMRVTNGKGVDVVLNSLSGEALRRSWDLLAPFGRFVEIGKKDAQANGKIELHPFLRNVTMTSVELPTMMRHRPEGIQRLIAETVKFYMEGKIKEAIPTNVMGYDRIEEGLRMLQSGKGMGKMVFKPSPEDLVPIVPEQLSPYQVEADVSYVLAGGLGGIGRSIAKWLVERGARNLVFLSRSGRITDSVERMKLELETAGCNVKIFTCDVSDKTRVEEVMEECKRDLPPIKGCIQASMVLKDGMFENMSYDTFETAVKPKVQGSWNLHELLPKDMDFFILLSSATGVLGNRSQANYAAGNTYQDALARYRISKGLPAAVIDLGTVLSVGYVAENKERTMMTRHLGTVLEVLREDEIHTLIEYLMDPRSKLSEPSCQLVSGLTSAATYRERGIPAPTYLSYPLFTHLRTASSSHSDGFEENPSFVVQAQLRAATSLEEATTVVANGVRAKLSSLLTIPQDNIEPGRSISSNGVDSLVAMEFRTYLTKDLGADVPLLDIMGTSSIMVLSQKIASVSKLVQISNEKGN